MLSAFCGFFTCGRSAIALVLVLLIRVLSTLDLGVMRGLILFFLICHSDYFS